MYIVIGWFLLYTSFHLNCGKWKKKKKLMSGCHYNGNIDTGNTGPKQTVSVKTYWIPEDAAWFLKDWGSFRAGFGWFGGIRSGRVQSQWVESGWIQCEYIQTGQFHCGRVRKNSRQWTVKTIDCVLRRRVHWDPSNLVVLFPELSQPYALVRQLLLQL